jgi:hypothetical protein
MAELLRHYVFMEDKMKMLIAASSIAFLFALFGCATGTSIVTGKVRPAINPSEVKLYLEPPTRYETIGIVEALSDVEFSSQAALDRAIQKLKAQAAKIGANGVLVSNTGDKSSNFGFYSGGVFSILERPISAACALESETSFTVAFKDANQSL